MEYLYNNSCKSAITRQILKRQIFTATRQFSQFLIGCSGQHFTSSTEVDIAGDKIAPIVKMLLTFRAILLKSHRLTLCHPKLEATMKPHVIALYIKLFYKIHK